MLKLVTERDQIDYFKDFLDWGKGLFTSGKGLIPEAKDAQKRDKKAS